MGSCSRTFLCLTGKTRRIGSEYVRKRLRILQALEPAKMVCSRHRITTSRSAGRVKMRLMSL